jgi:hypothetical protein
MVNHQQREIRECMGVMRSPTKVPNEFIKACHSELEALNLCMNLSNLSDEAIRDHLGIDKGHFSRIRKGRGNFPPNKRVALMQLCGNLAPVQYEAHRVGFSLQENDKDAQIAALRAQLMELTGSDQRMAA